MIKRTFKAWRYEMKKISDKIKSAGLELGKVESTEQEILEMYYRGGYSPRMTILEILRVPAGWDIL